MANTIPIFVKLIVKAVKRETQDDNLTRHS